MDAGALAGVVVARRRVKQAQNDLRRAGQRLASAERVCVFGEHTCTTLGDVDAVVAMVRFALSEHPKVEVVVLI